MVVLPDVDRPDLSCERIHILKKVPVDGLQVLQVEIAFDRIEAHFQRSTGRMDPFYMVQLLLIPNIKMVNQNGGTRIAVLATHFVYPRYIAAAKWVFLIELTV